MGRLTFKPYKTGSSLEQREQSPPASPSPLSGCRRFFLRHAMLTRLAILALLLAVPAAQAEDFLLTAEGLDRYEQATEIFYAWAVMHPDLSLQADGERLGAMTDEEFRAQIAAVAPELLERSESTRLNSSHVKISYAVFCLKKKIKKSQRVITSNQDNH